MQNIIHRMYLSPKVHIKIENSLSTNERNVKRPLSDASIVEGSFKTRIRANQQHEISFLNTSNTSIQQVVRSQVSAVAMYNAQIITTQQST